MAELNREYIARMEDVLATYEEPLDIAEPVVCVDEKPVSLHDDVRPRVPAVPGTIAKRDNECGRCGTAHVFCAVEPKVGVHFTWPTPNRSAAQFAQAIGNLVEHYSAASTIHLVMDDLNIHCRKSLTDYYGVERGRAIWDRFTVHYTPKQHPMAMEATARFGGHTVCRWGAGRCHVRVRVSRTLSSCRQPLSYFYCVINNKSVV